MARGVEGGGAMKITIHITIQSDNGQLNAAQEVAQLDRATLRPETVGLSLAEARAILAGLEQTVVDGLTVELLQDMLPISTTAIGRRVRQMAQRLEDELGEEQDIFIDGCQRDWDQLPDPSAPLFVGIDGGAEIEKELECLKWNLWHGNVHKALQIVEDLEVALDIEENSQKQRKLLKAVREFGTYITSNTNIHCELRRSLLARRDHLDRYC